MGQEVICSRQLPRALVSGWARILCLQPTTWHCHFLCLPQFLACSFLDAGQIDAHPQAGHPGPVNSNLLEKRLRVVEIELHQPCWVEETQLPASCLLAPGRREGYITLDRTNSLCYYSRASPPGLTSASSSPGPWVPCWPFFQASVCSPVK